jgi:hypothetical protein
MPDQSPDEIINNAVSIASNKDQARKLCSTLREVRDQDRCYETLATEAGQSYFCLPISSTARRDACLMEFALEGEYGVCPNVENEYLRKSCESLKYLSE